MDVRIGARFRALRHRLGWRQEDVAHRAGISQDVVSFVERGLLERVSIRNLRAIAGALDAEFFIQLRWRGGDLDRLVDEGHATLVGAITRLLTSRGWQVRIEVTYAVYRERGSIDVLAWHAATRTLLVVEVKSDLTSIEETLRKHDEKTRLAPRIAAADLGWVAASVARLLVLPDLSTPRRRVARHEAALGAAYPARRQWLRDWLGAPTGRMSGLLFVDAAGGSQRPGSTARKRISRLTSAA